MDESSWHNEYVLASRERMLGRTNEVRDALRSGELVRVSRGVYRYARARTSDEQRQPDDDYLAQIRGAQLRASEPLIVAGMSAAAAWDLPVVGNWPARVIVAAEREDGGRSNAHLARSYVGYPPPTTTRGGLLVTTLARTVADVARTETFERAVAVTDAALRGRATSPTRAGRERTTKGAVARELQALAGATGTGRAQAVLAFADAASGSPGESCSRAGIHRLGFPAPQLQKAFVDSHGQIGIVDFWWPGCNLVGEFDGRGKYLRDEYANGRSTAEIVLDEKRREDRLRALGLRVVRWGWADALDLRRLEAKLRAAGLR